MVLRHVALNVKNGTVDLKTPPAAITCGRGTARCPTVGDAWACVCVALCPFGLSRTLPFGGSGRSHFNSLASAPARHVYRVPSGRCVGATTTYFPSAWTSTPGSTPVPDFTQSA